MSTASACLSVDDIDVHEMTHLFERNYGERFITLMGAFLPG
jgi:predicted metal-dependent hydrolase